MLKIELKRSSRGCPNLKWNLPELRHSLIVIKLAKTAGRKHTGFKAHKLLRSNASLDPKKDDVPESFCLSSRCIS